MDRAIRILLLAGAMLGLAGCAANQASGLARPSAGFQAEPAALDAARVPLLTLVANDSAGTMRHARAMRPFLALGFAATPQGGGLAEGDRFPLLRSVGPVAGSALAGRTLAISRISDIALEDKEVVLTFDDGPVPGKTPAILEALRRYGVGATFLMVGDMARAHPQLVRDVAQDGHTIGTHTQNHRNLSQLGDEAAFDEIHAGQASVSRALRPAGLVPAPFFRFPYLADRPSLRDRLSREGIVAIDTDIDSKDYFQTPAAMVRDRTLLALAKHGRGIILMHDIHQRTAEMLPGLLLALQERGFKVVHLVPAGQAPLVAALEGAARSQ